MVFILSRFQFKQGVTHLRSVKMTELTYDETGKIQLIEPYRQNAIMINQDEKKYYSQALWVLFLSLNINAQSGFHGRGKNVLLF